MLNSKVNEAVHLEVMEKPENNANQQSCFSNWIGRCVKSRCPGEEYTHETYLKVSFTLRIIGIISFATLLIGTVWKDSMDDTQKIILSTTAGSGAIGSIISYLANDIIYKNQPSS